MRGLWGTAVSKSFSCTSRGRSGQSLNAAWPSNFSNSIELFICHRLRLTSHAVKDRYRHATGNLSRHQKRRKHLLPIFFVHFRLGVDSGTRLGFEPIPAFRASPEIKHQLLAYEFGPIRSNQRLTAFGTRRRHGNLPCLLLFSHSRAGSFLDRYSRVPDAASCIDPDQKQASFSPFTVLRCSKREPAIPAFSPQFCGSPDEPSPAVNIEFNQTFVSHFQ